MVRVSIDDCGSASEAEHADVLLAVQAKSRACGACGAPSARRRCGQCRAVRYCDRNCQRRHWYAGHASICGVGAASLWADFDTFALVLAGLSVREACRAMAVCPAWRRWGPELVRVARWRGHPAARPLRSKPHGQPSWRALHVAETWLLFEDFHDTLRWRPLGGAAEAGDLGASQAPGVVSAGGEESVASPLIAAALVSRSPGSSRPQRLQVTFRCTPREPWGRCTAYVVIGEPEACAVVGGTEFADVHSRHVAACAFVAWSPLRRGLGRRVAGLLGAGAASPPAVDAEVLAGDRAELELRLAWGLDADGRDCLEAVALQVGPFGRVVAEGKGIGSAGCIILGVSPGATAEFLKVCLS